MSYRRNTADEYVLFADYGYGWDEVLMEADKKEIRQRLKEYRQNTCAVLKIAKRRIHLQTKEIKS